MAERSHARRGKQPTGGGRKADPSVTNAISDRLRSFYDDVLSEPVPDELALLVKRLAGDTNGGSKPD